MSASATSANAGLCLGWRTSIPTQEPLRPTLQDRKEGAFSQSKSNGGQICARLCFNYWGFIHSFSEFHSKALNKTSRTSRIIQAPMGDSLKKQASR